MAGEVIKLMSESGKWPLYVYLVGIPFGVLYLFAHHPPNFEGTVVASIKIVAFAVIWTGAYLFLEGAKRRVMRDVA